VWLAEYINVNNSYCLFACTSSFCSDSHDGSACSECRLKPHGSASYGKANLFPTTTSRRVHSYLRCGEIVCQCHPTPTVCPVTPARVANFRPYAYWPLVLLSCAITQHLATVFIFLSVFARLKSGLLDPRILVWVSVVLFFVGLLLWQLLDWTDEDNELSKQSADSVFLSPKGSIPLGFLQQLK
jgi:hypothetical protein